MKRSRALGVPYSAHVPRLDLRSCLLLYFASQGTPTTRSRADGGAPASSGSSMDGSGRWGALHSEVKEERRAKPDAGDMSGAARPGVPIARQHLTMRQ